MIEHLRQARSASEDTQNTEYKIQNTTCKNNYINAFGQRIHPHRLESQRTTDQPSEIMNVTCKCDRTAQDHGVPKQPSSSIFNVDERKGK